MTPVAEIHGFEAVDLDRPTPSSLRFRFHKGYLLVVADRHAIGVRAFRGGREVLATPRDCGSDRVFPLRQFAIRDGDVIHAVLAIDDHSDFDLVTDGAVPEPFDRFEFGGEQLPA